MANPQKENGYTAISNELLEQIYKLPLNGSEFRILLVVIRKTYGYHKKVDNISLTQFQKHTGIIRNNVCRSLKTLVSALILAKSDNGYSLNKNYDEWVVSELILPRRVVSKQAKGGINVDTKGGIKSAFRVVSSLIPTKETITKETKDNIQKIGDVTVGVQKVFDIFYEFNPTINFGNKTSRKAAEDLIKKFGEEKTIAYARAAKAVYGKQYAPTITTPYLLKEKLAELAAFFQKKQAPQKGTITKIPFNS